MFPVFYKHNIYRDRSFLEIEFFPASLQEMLLSFPQRNYWGLKFAGLVFAGVALALK